MAGDSLPFSLSSKALFFALLRCMKSGPSDLLTLVRFLRAMLSFSLFRRVWQMGTWRSEAYLEKIRSQAGHWICLISCARLKQLNYSLSFT